MVALVIISLHRNRTVAKNHPFYRLHNTISHVVFFPPLAVLFTLNSYFIIFMPPLNLTFK